MIAACIDHPWVEIMVAVITATGGIGAAAIRRVYVDLEDIRGLLNGTRRQALAEIELLYRSRLAKGQPLRRSTDRILEDDHPV